MPLTPNTRLGPYEITGLLGTGGMGEVYRARDPRLQRQVAIKVVRASSPPDPELATRLEREARAAGGLQHPNIVSVFDVGAQDGAFYIVEELLDGETLGGRLRQGPLLPKKAVEYAIQLARGLAAAHLHGIIHRDIKPDNIFLTNDGQVKILDFGLARSDKAPDNAPEAQTLTVTAAHPGVVLGTVGYMSPEQVHGQPADFRSDIFSFGAVLYEMLTGNRAFQGASAIETLSAIVRDEPPDLAPSAGPLMPALDRVLRHCLEKEPQRRFQSIEDVAFSLESLPLLSGSAPIPRAAVSRRPTWLAASLAAILIATGCGLSFLVRPAAHDSPEYRFTPIATDQTSQREPAWSPDGKSIAYTAVVDGVFRVFTRDISQATPEQLTRTGPGASFPFWSKGGERVYYRSGGGLWSVGAAGGQPQQVATGVGSAHISRDGNLLVYAHSEKGIVSLYAESPPGSQPKKLAFTLAVGGSPYLRISPDARKIGIWANGRGGHEFHVVTYPEGDRRLALAAVTMVRGQSFLYFDWMPDSRHIIFSGGRTRTGRDHLVLADTVTGIMRPVTNGIDMEGDPSVSPDGASIAFASRKIDDDIISVPFDGSPVRPLLATSRNEHCASWSPVRPHYLYTRERAGTEEVWLHNEEDGTERPLVTTASFPAGETGRISEPVFSPDGRRLAFLRAQESSTISVVGLAGGTPVQVAEGVYPTWSPDGEWLALVVSTKEGPRLGKVPSGGGKPPVLIGPLGRYSFRPQWSPAGDWIVWSDKGGELLLVRPDGNQTVELASATRVNTPGWSKDGSILYVPELTPERKLLLRSFDVRKRQERRPIDFGSFPSISVIHGFSLAPDNKTFALSILREAADIWMLKGFDLKR